MGIPLHKYMMCAHVCIYVYMNACGDQRRVSDSLEDGVTGTVST